jgi:hypothetical protein
MGHHGSPLAEKHYRKRRLDLLRKWHDIIEAEAWILDPAGIDFVPAQTGCVLWSLPDKIAHEVILQTHPSEKSPSMIPHKRAS